MNTAPESQACSVPLTNPRGLDGNPIGRGPLAPSFEMMRDELGIPRRQTWSWSREPWWKMLQGNFRPLGGGIPKFVNQKKVDSNSQESTSLVWDDKSWRMWGSLLKSLATPLGRPYEVCASTAVRDASPRTTVVRRGNSRNSSCQVFWEWRRQIQRLYIIDNCLSIFVFLQDWNMEWYMYTH